MTAESDGFAVAELARAEIPEWISPTGYREGLALAILDSIWSIGVRYDGIVVPVLGRYREWRREQGADPAVDGAVELREAIRSAGGPEAFASDVVRNRNRTSTRNGILKADAVARCVEGLIDAGIATAGGLRSTTLQV